MTNVDPVQQRRQLAADLANQLDTKDGKKDGKINASVWNEFVAGKGGKTIQYSISLDNAVNSISTYLAKNSVSTKDSVHDLAEKWAKPVEPKPEAKLPRQQAEIKTVEGKYAKAQNYINNINAGNAMPSIGYPMLYNNLGPFSGIDKETLAYILKLEPNFFDNAREKIAPADLKRDLLELAKALGIKDVDGKPVEELIMLIKDAVKDVNVPEKPSKEETSQRRILDKIAEDTKALKMPAFKPVEGKTEAELNAHWDKNKFNLQTDGKVDDNKVKMLKLAIANGKIDIQDALYSLTPAEQRSILRALIGNEKADKVDRNKLADKIVEESINFAKAEKERIDGINASVTKVNDGLAAEAVEIVARLNNDTANLKTYVNKNGHKVIYNEKLNEAIFVKGGSYQILKGFDAKTDKGDYLAHINPDGNLLFDVDNDNKTYETSAKSMQYYTKFKTYVDGLVNNLEKK